MKQQQYVYKIVSNWNKTTKSGESACISGPYSLPYTLGKKTVAHPGTTGIFCYRDKRKAQTAALQTRGGERVLECEFTGELREPDCSLVIMYKSLSNATRIFARVKTLAKKFGIPLMDVPSDTVCVDSITPVAVYYRR